MDLRERIIKETGELCFKYGIKRITMDDIARQLGISKKTIYQHFRDKNEIVELLIANLVGFQSEVMDKNAALSENSVKEVFMLVTHLKEMLSKINPMLFYDLQKYHPVAWEAFSAFRDRYFKNNLIKNLNRGISEGLFREELNLEIMSILRIEELNMIFNQQAFHAGRFNLADVMNEVSEHYLYGICTLKGHTLIDKYKQQ